MKNIKFFILIFCLIFCSCCQVKKNNLNNTKWVFHFDNCDDYIFFKDDQKMEIFSCETENTIWGNYQTKNNQIILENLCSQDDYRENSLFKISNLKYYLVIENNQLQFLELWQYDEVSGTWKKSDFIFDDKYIFKRIDENE